MEYAGGGRSRLTLLAFTVAPDLRRSRTHPSCPFFEAIIRAVSPQSWTHTRAILKGQRGETKGHAGVRRAPCSWAVGKMAPCRAGAAGATEDRGDDDAGAHARHKRRRTNIPSGLCQLTLPPRLISRLSSASSPSLAASYTALPSSSSSSSESLIASAALIRPSPARTPADSGGHARLHCDA
jgi:hypothetical protein